jgi:hypothetical protein
MARTGPTTRDSSTIALGLAQIRVGVAATHIASVHPALTASDSIGALANTKFTGKTDWYKLESGFPLLEDFTTAIREAASLECAFKEITPYNLAIAYGKDPATYTDVHSGEIELGGRVSPDYVRMEAIYTFPNGTNTMSIIFPRAQVSASMELDLKMEDAAAAPIVFEAKRADSEVTGGNSAWDDKPLGRIAFAKILFQTGVEIPPQSFKENVMNTSDEMVRLNPQIKDVEIGIRNLRSIKIYPLSVSDQLTATNLVTSALQVFMTNKDVKNNDLLFVAFMLEQIRTNASEILKMVLDETESPEAVLKEMSNEQMMVIVKAIYEVNYESLSKNVKSLLEKKKESVSERQSQQSVKSMDTNSMISSENPGEMVE